MDKRKGSCFLFIIAFISCFFFGTAKVQAQHEKPNVLFIAVDDLNDWIGALAGHPQAHTPNIDRLADSGTIFTRAYCASPLCGPSRAALLYGLRPHSTGAYGHQNGHDPRILIPKTTLSMPQNFQRNGYYTAGCGKIFHMKFHDERGWDEYLTNASSKAPDKSNPDVIDYPLSFGPIDDASDGDMGDMKLAYWASDRIKAAREKPFFIAVGFKKPHMPWYAPRKYFDLHSLDQVKLPQTNEGDLEDIPAIGRFIASPGVAFNGPEKGDHHELLRLGLWNRAVQAYLATCSFVDSCVGTVLRALEESGKAEETIVILWGDHGWHLGEKLHWRKHALWEESTRTTLLIRAPGLTSPGSRCVRTVSLPDIYPTLIELAGLTTQEVEANSITTLLRNPAAEWETPALTTFGPGNHSVRDERWRYTRYSDGSEELYDHSIDPNEFTNLAHIPKNSSIKAKLSKWIPRKDKPDPANDSSFKVLEKFKKGTD